MPCMIERLSCADRALPLWYQSFTIGIGDERDTQDHDKLSQGNNYVTRNISHMVCDFEV